MRFDWLYYQPRSLTDQSRSRVSMVDDLTEFYAVLIKIAKLVKQCNRRLGLEKDPNAIVNAS